MKKKRQSLSRLLALLALLWYLPGIYAATWVDSVVTSVTDDDLILDASAGNILLPSGGTSINAVNVDITVTLINGDVTIQGNTESQLYICAAADRTITFDLTGLNDLTFIGSNTGDPLLISTCGEGTVVFLLSGGRTLTFGLEGFPVSLFHLMLDVDEYTPKPTLIFKRQDVTPSQNDQNIEIIIGPNSLITYLSTSPNVTGTDSACIIFNPSNQGEGNMILDIANTGGYIISGHFVDASVIPGDITFENIQLERAAGRNAITRIINQLMDDEYARDEYEPQPHGCLLVINRNSTCFELLVDPFTNQGAAEDLVNFRGTFNGIQYGFVLGANGTLEIDDNACLDYVGLANNQCPCVDQIFVQPPPCCPGQSVRDCPCDCGNVESIVKARNYSAFIVDGNLNPASTPAQIILGEQSGIYFRSGIDCNGDINDNLADPFVFTVDPDKLTRGAGDIVFDVEGLLNVFGSDTDTVLNSRLEILSLHVFPFGGPLFPGLIGETIFPIRSGAVDADGVLRRYNKAAWLINNRMNLFNTSLAHTDENHLIFQANDVDSEATYIGGERFFISELQGDDPVIPRPKIAFVNSRLLVNTDVAFTGVDLLVPNYVIDSQAIVNISFFTFFSNGFIVDNGTGRQMILGTLIGSEACDNCTIINRDAHLDVIQETDAVGPVIRVFPTEEDQLLNLTVDVNSPQLIQAINGNDITGQHSIHNIFLGGASNISIGTNVEPPNTGTGFNFNTTPTIAIAGNYFSFNTRGGSAGIPDKSNVTGEGGIFVDTNGVFGILPEFRASMATMVTKSGNGCVVLPPNQVVFDSRIGVADWQLDLSIQQPDTVLVGPGQIYSDYTLDWIATKKDFDNFLPYEIGNVNIANCPPVLPENVTSLPTFQGTVEQLQIQDSRIGDAATFIIDGGHVRELLWLTGGRPAEAATALVILQNNGRIGINTAHRNVDSIFTQTTLGVNGISFIANGSGRIDLNEDVIVNNICAFLRGPDFTDTDVLEIHADTPHVLRVVQGGTLDFSDFNTASIVFTGEVVVIFETSADFVLSDNEIITFSGNSVVQFTATPQQVAFFAELASTLGPIDNSIDPTNSVDATQPHNEFSPLINLGDGVNNTDQFRSRIVGEGTIRLTENARIIINENAIVGIETMSLVMSNNQVFQIETTNIRLELLDNSEFIVDEGAALQIGNTTDLLDHTVNFTLLIDGIGAEFVTDSRSFVGFGAGLVLANQPTMSQTYADVLFNVGSITFDFRDGTFFADRIFSSDDPRAQAIVIGDAEEFNLIFADDPLSGVRDRNFEIHGGANLYLILPGEGFNDGAMALINRLDDDVIEAPVTGGDPVTVTRMRVGILASTALLDNITVTGLTPTEFFETIKVAEGTVGQTRDTGLAVAAPIELREFRSTTGRVGFIDRDRIGRFNFSDVIDFNANGGGATSEDRRLRAFDIGAVAVQVDTSVAPPGPPLFITQLQ